MTKPQLQSTLGTVAKSSTHRDRSWNNGYLAFGKVLKVHHKRYTADVKIFGSGDTIMSSKDQEGVHSCRIGVSNAGFDKKYKKPYGEIIPIQENSIVLVAFMKNTREKPVILRVFHDITEDTGEVNHNNILTSIYPMIGETEIYRYTKISRIQDFVTIDGIGNFEVSSHTKSFFVGFNKKELDEENFDYEDLSISNTDQTTIGVDEKYSKPMKYLAVFRDKFIDSISNSLRIIIDSSKTAFKLAKLQVMDNKVSMIEIDQDGAIRVRRQMDTKSWQEESREYSEICITKDGEIELKICGDKKTYIKTGNQSIKVDTDCPVDVTSKSDINITGELVDVNNGTVKVTEDLVYIDKDVQITGDVNVSKNLIRIKKNVEILGDVSIIGNVSITGRGEINGKRIAVKGDSVSDGSIIL